MHAAHAQTKKLTILQSILTKLMRNFYMPYSINSVIPRIISVPFSVSMLHNTASHVLNHFLILCRNKHFEMWFLPLGLCPYFYRAAGVDFPYPYCPNYDASSKFDRSRYFLGKKDLFLRTENTTCCKLFFFSPCST